MFYKAAGKVIGNKGKRTRELGKDPISLEPIEKSEKWEDNTGIHAP